ncbi:28 kDa ribonucleoprotein, chloroplastic-like [Rutidosis leptorrhynchoides]|uniref:28 kDa ribonucleoprotein, chloroplastic-like n=1 Tax=Rutidosis leptorrhynchoides TaxID=125765 RepID=UPI003A99E0F3
MAALESLKLSYFQYNISSSTTNPKLEFPPKSNLSIKKPILTPNIFFKKNTLSISRKFHVCLLSLIQQEISIVEEVKDEELEETQKDDNKKKLFVVGLPWSFTAGDVRNFFGECGTVADVEIIKREDGKRGFVFVTMSSGEEALAVTNRFNSFELLGRILKVEYAKKFKKPTPRSPTALRSNETRHKLFVSNLAWKVRATNLKQFFADYNPVSTRVVFSPSGSSAGYGFVSFASKQEADSALSALEGKELLGRSIILKVSEKSTDKHETNNENANTSEERHDVESYQ